MTVRDARNTPLSGADGAAAERFERALAAFQCWRTSAAGLAEATVDDAPRFTMGWVLRCWLALCGRDPAGARIAAPWHARALAGPANDRERAHLHAIGAVIADDYERALDVLGGLLARDPYDVLALQVAHALDYLGSDATIMHERVASVASAWRSGMPGHHAVLAMLAFAQEEVGRYDEAEDTALRALALEPNDARAHHALAHVYEMTARPRAGIRLMGDRMAHWAGGTTVATHCWWHLALFHLERGDARHALTLYDRRVRGAGPALLSDLIDASALLWRLALRGADVGPRWQPLAADWEARIGDRFCTFTDLHAMMAFVGAGDERAIARMLADLERGQSTGSRHAATTRRIGLPACRALAAFGRGDYAAAIAGLGALPVVARRLGGSHAQRDVLNLTLLEAVERLRGRPGWKHAA
jgi:tetratricopeptide (TPR) repeat protein